MTLAIDVGNAFTVIGVMRGREVVATIRISTVERTTDELGILLRQLLEHRGFSPEDVVGGIVASVEPAVMFTMQKAATRYFGIDLLVVGRGLKTGLRIRTDNPREVGADRIVNSVGALERYGGPVVVVGFGAATTFDCVTARGDYVGGAIAPGFKPAERALFDSTAKLPRVEVKLEPDVIARNTEGAIQSGLFWGYLGLVDGLAARCCKALGGEATIVATGEMSSSFMAASERIDEVDPWLTLHGLALLWERNGAG